MLGFRPVAARAVAAEADYVGATPTPPAPAPREAEVDVVGARETRIKPLLQRVLESRRARAQPKNAGARKRARAIVAAAADLVQNDAGEQELRALMARWSDLKPLAPPAVAGIDPYELFMAQIALYIAAARQQEDDEEEETAVALLLMN